MTTAMGEDEKRLTFELVQHDASGISMEKIKWKWGTGPEGNGRKEWVLLEGGNAQWMSMVCYDKSTWRYPV